MAFSLRNLVKKTYDQANVFDGGKTWKNPSPTPVRRPAPVASTARPTSGGLQVRPLNQPRRTAPAAPLAVARPSAPRQNLAVQQSRASRLGPVQIAAPKPLSVGNTQIKAGGGRTNVAGPSGRGPRWAELAQVPMLSGQRVGVGVFQAASGAVDLATPGKGTNRFSNRLKTTAENLDFNAQKQGVSGQYKGANVVGEVASLVTGVGLGKQIAKQGAKLAPKTANVINNGAKVFESKVATATSGLVNGNRAQRVAGQTARIGLKPTNIAIENGFSGYQLSKEASQGQDISKERVAAEVAINSLGIPAALAVGKEVVLPAAKATSRLVRNAPQAATDVLTNKPFRNISDEEVDAVERMTRLRAGQGEDISGVRPEDGAIYANVQAKLGVAGNDTRALDDLIAARRTYQAEMANMKNPAVQQGGYVRMPDGTKLDKPFYHGTTADFKEFDNAKVGSNTGVDNAKLGHFFLEDKARAEKFLADNGNPNGQKPRVVEAELDINNPADLTIDGLLSNKKQAADIYEIVTGERISPDEALEELDEAIDLNGEFFQGLYQNPNFRKELQAKGYDGAISEFGRDGKVVREFVAFDSKQIRQIPSTKSGPKPRPTRGVLGDAQAKAKAMLDEPKTKGFFKDETEIDQTNRILKNEDTVAGGRKIADYYREAKGEDWRVEQMSPDEYLRQAAKAMGMKTDQEIADWASKPMGDPAKYAADMKKGDKFPMPWLNEALGSQEGRTRALAAKLNGADTIPVAVARKFDRNAAKPADALATQAPKKSIAQKFGLTPLNDSGKTPVNGPIVPAAQVAKGIKKLTGQDKQPAVDVAKLYKDKPGQELTELAKQYKSADEFIAALKKQADDEYAAASAEFRKLREEGGDIFDTPLTKKIDDLARTKFVLASEGNLPGEKNWDGKTFEGSGINGKRHLREIYKQATGTDTTPPAKQATQVTSKPAQVPSQKTSGSLADNSTVKGLDGKQLEVVDGDVVLYHNTSKDGLAGINKDGYLDPQRAGTGNDKAVTIDGRVSYTSTKPQDMFGSEVVKVRMPIEEFKKQLQDNADAIARLEADINDPNMPNTYKDSWRRQVENIKANPEILSKTPLKVASTDTGSATKPTAQLSDKAVPALTPQLLKGASSTKSTPALGTPIKKAAPVDTKDYVKSMTQQQKAAQKGKKDVKGTVADAKEKFLDDLSPIEDRLNKAIKNGVSLDPKDHITYQLDRSRRAEGIMNAYVRDNKLDKIIQQVDKADEFDQYLIARHAKELDEGITTGRDPKQDAELVKALDGKYGEQAKQLYEYNQKLLDKATDYGLISKEGAAALKVKYPEYVPFNRIFNEDEMANLAGGVGRGDASIGSQSVVKKIKGSERAIASPLNSIIDKTRVVIEQGERNKAAQMLADYRKLPDNPFNLSELKPDENIAGRPVISFLDKGVKRTFLTDKVIADAAKNMSRQDIGLWGRIAAIPARALRGGATAANVGFAGANIVKDMVGAAINSKHPVRIADPVVFGKALQAAFKHEGKAYQELMREGVSGTSFDMFRNPLKSNVPELRSHKNLATRAAYIAKNPGQIYRTVENTIGRSEDFGRALQYYSNKKGYLADGKKASDATILAADQARHNSTNFFRHGSVGKGVNLAVPYWNAGVQGARIQVRRVKERPVETLTKMGVAIVAPSAMIALNNYSDEKKREVIENIPDYEKQGNIIIVGPNAKYNKDKNEWDGVYKFPVPPQHIGIHNTVQSAVKAAKTGEAFDIAKNLGLIAENYTTINATSPREIANRYTPQAVKLIAEPTTNTNMYTGNKIVPDSQKNLPAEDQSNEYSSGTAKTIGKVFNVSPRQVDNSIRTGFGGAGQNLLKATDSALAAAKVIKKEEVKGKSLGESISGRFYGPNAISPGDKADKEFAKLKKDIVASKEYKNATPYDKGRMLNRLEKDLNEVQYRQADAKNQTGEYAPDFKGKTTKLTKKQQELASSGFRKENYTNLDTAAKTSSTAKTASGITAHSKKVLDEYNKLDSATRNKKFQNEPDYEWKYEKSRLENDIALGKLSGPQKATRIEGMKRIELGKTYTKEARELVTKKKPLVLDYVTNHPNGQKLADDIMAYDAKLFAAGLIPYARFDEGIAPVGKGGGKKTASSKGGSGGSRSSGGRRSSGGGRATGKGSRGGKTQSEINTAAIARDFASTIASISKTNLNQDRALRNIVNKKRITRKATVR